MAVPRQRKTRGRSNQRRMHLYLKQSFLALCSKCGKKMRPHNICPNCGYYKGVEVINVLEKLTKKERKKREKEIAAKEKEGKAVKPLTMEEMSKKA